VQAEKTPFGFMLVLEPGDELIRSLTAFARQEDIDGATITGSGRVRELELGFYDPITADYVRSCFSDHFEMCSLTGTLPLLDGEPFPQLHGVFGRSDFSTMGGLIFEAVCGELIEIGIYTMVTPLVRKLEPRA
jgi:predicted DNA-binding protein with PD1-like motif